VASEVNNERFEVLKSTTGIDWYLLDQVPGRGTAQTAKTYAVLDGTKPSGGTSYYRIRQIDYDGGSTLSEVVAYLNPASTSAKSNFRLIENPIAEQMNLESSDASTVTATLYDLTGKSLHTFQLSSGRNSIAWPTSLSAGMYVLQANTSQGIESLKLVKR